jgi:hypothetical protein
MLFVVRPVAYLSVEHLSGANIRLGWKGVEVTNTVAYYEHFKITDAVSFITLGPMFVKR